MKCTRCGYFKISFSCSRLVYTVLHFEALLLHMDFSLPSLLPSPLFIFFLFLKFYRVLGELVDPGHCAGEDVGARVGLGD